MISKLFRILILTGLFSSIAVAENVDFVKRKDSRVTDSVLISQNDVSSMECDRDKTDDYWTGDRDKTDDYLADDLISKRGKIEM